MFVKNLTNDILTVRKSGKVLKLKPGVNCVDGFWSAEFLKSIYGPQYIICYNEEAKEEAEVEVKEEKTEEVKADTEEKAEVKADTEEVKEVKAETEEKAEDTKVEVAEVKEEKTEAKKEEAKEKKPTKNTAKNTTKNK